MIKILKGFTIFEVVCCIIGAIVNFIYSDVINGIFLIVNAVYAIALFVSIDGAYNRSLSNENKIDRTKNSNSAELKTKITQLEIKIEQLTQKIAALSNEDTAEVMALDKPKAPECPFCGHSVSESDKECPYCGFDLKNGTL